MKRATLIAVVALTILFAMTTSAFAADVSPDGNWADWSDTGSNAATPTPHVAYSTTTVKCAVCHSVHNADTSANNSQNILLRSTKNDSCTYCHMDSSITDSQPYGDGATGTTNYETDTDFNHSNASTNFTDPYAGCPSCHSVHGANTYKDAVVTSILKNNIAANEAWVPSPGADRASILTEYCEQCHHYYPDPSSDGGYDVADDGQGNHIMTSTYAAYDNPEASGSATGSPVANAGSGDCVSCHDAYAAAVANSFPHYMPNNARFLLAAPSQGAATENVADPSVDGACIKCHLWNGGTNGVGEDF